MQDAQPLPQSPTRRSGRAPRQSNRQTSAGPGRGGLRARGVVIAKRSLHFMPRAAMGRRQRPPSGTAGKRAGALSWGRSEQGRRVWTRLRLGVRSHPEAGQAARAATNGFWGAQDASPTQLDDPDPRSQADRVRPEEGGGAGCGAPTSL